MLQFLQTKNEAAGQRGVAMIIALFLVVIILAVSIAVLATTANSANGSLSVQTKNQTFNAAEAGLDTAIYQIDYDNATASGTIGPPATVNGYTYTWEVVKNNLGKPSSTTAADPDPAFAGKTVSVGLNQAYLAGWASSVTGGRTVYVEAMVIPGPPISFTSGAIISGQIAQISHEQITDTSGKHGGDIRAHQITSSGGGQRPDGNSYATCNVSGCNAITGWDGYAYIDQPAPVFLTSRQIATIQSSALAQAQSGGNNVYVNGDWSSSGTWGSSSGNCTVYINGNVTLSAGTLTNWCTTIVVTGNWTMSGSAQFTITPTTTTHAIYVLGAGGATINGTTNTMGFVYSANGPIVLNGSGTGTFDGVLYSPYNITMNGGGTGSFNYDPVQSQAKAPNPNVLPVSQWEY